MPSLTEEKTGVPDKPAEKPAPKAPTVSAAHPSTPPAAKPAAPAQMPPIQPEMQAAIDEIKKQAPYADTPPSPDEAGILGQSGSDVGGVHPAAAAPPASSPKPAPTPVPSKAAAAAPPAVKEILDHILHTGPEGEVAPITDKDIQEGKPKGETWQDYLKGAMGKVGEFLQRWGLNEQGAPGVQTKGEIQQAQQFELAKAEKQAQVQAQMMNMENQYQTQRMQLQNQMNLAALPIEKKIDLQNQMAVLDAEYQQKLKLLPLEIQQQMLMHGLTPDAKPGNFWSKGK